MSWTSVNTRRSGLGSVTSTGLVVGGRLVVWGRLVGGAGLVGLVGFGLGSGSPEVGSEFAKRLNDFYRLSELGLESLLSWRCLGRRLGRFGLACA